METIRLRIIQITIALTIAFAVSSVMFTIVKANPSAFTRANNTVCGNFTATTTPTYMSAGNATTTINYDTACASALSADRATLAVQFTGSSTASTLNIGFEYSQDGVDWYSDRISAGATTTQTVSLVQPTTYTMPFASSTVGGAAGTGNGRLTRVIDVPTPTRYVRAILTLPAGSLNGAAWAEFIGKKQNP